MDDIEKEIENMIGKCFKMDATLYLESVLKGNISLYSGFTFNKQCKPPYCELDKKDLILSQKKETFELIDKILKKDNVKIPERLNRILHGTLVNLQILKKIIKKERGFCAINMETMKPEPVLKGLEINYKQIVAFFFKFVEQYVDQDVDMLYELIADKQDTLEIFTDDIDWENEDLK